MSKRTKLSVSAIAAVVAVGVAALFLGPCGSPESEPSADDATATALLRQLTSLDESHPSVDATPPDAPRRRSSSRVGTGAGGGTSSSDPAADGAGDADAPQVLLAMRAGDPSLCNHPPPTPQARIDLCHDEYHFFLSLKEGADRCGRIEQKMLRDACRMIVSGDNRCSELVPEKTIDGLHEPDDIERVCESCLGNLGACDAIEDEHDHGLCTSMHYLVKAAKAKDPSFCDRIVDENDNHHLCRFVAER